VSAAAYRGPAFGIGHRTWIKRSLLCVLQPLTGPRATGSALAYATGADVELQRGTYAVPAMAGAVSAQTDHMRLVKVAATTTVTSAGTSVPFVSALGGEIQNLAEGTTLRWTPAITGLAPTATVESMSGGSTLTVPGTLRRIALFDKLGITKSTLVGDAWRSRIGSFPAGVLAWTGAARGDAVGTDARLRRLRFRLFVIATNIGSAEERTEEADAILDHVEALLEGRSAVDGEVFSQPPIAVGQSGILTADDGSYVHFVDIETSTTIQRIEHRTFAEWLETQQTFLSSTTPEYPAPEDALTLLDLQHTQ
jgi:hypothetical protein